MSVLLPPQNAIIFNAAGAPANLKMISKMTHRRRCSAEK
ncbi:hypothetical protein X965_11165 [Morganella sp. EGD-HP17]|nr:hypothetical protein X965_11165 [Morganella sp. EGD-HP17]